MINKWGIAVILRNILLVVCLAGLFARNSHADENSKYLKAVREFADNVLKYGRDTYGPEHTPLFVDGLSVDKHEPVTWIAPNGDRWILSNLASQQNLFRTLVGLTNITGDPKYKQAAMEAIEYAFENLRSPNGLLYWGSGAAYDALGDEFCGREHHVFKCFYPYYELMWHVGPEATKQFIEALWSAHIRDWSNLDSDRIALFDSSLQKPWNYEYRGGPVFFEGGHSSLGIGSDLFYAAALLSHLSDQREPLIWAKRLAYRYIETRNQRTGISGLFYTRPPLDVIEYALGDEFKGHAVHRGTLFPVHPQLGDPMFRKWEAGYHMVSPGIPVGYPTTPWICYLLVGAELDKEGKEFTQWALEELTALGKVAYRKKDNSWIPMLTDGTILEGYVCKNYGYGPKGTVFKAVAVVPMDFWGYTLAYRLTHDEFMWEMARNIAQGNGLGDVGATPEDDPKLQIPKEHFDPYTLLAFLELYRKTGKAEFLQAAQEVGDNILATRFHRGLFVPSSKHIYAKFDAIEALILLHLDATTRKKGLLIPKAWPGRSYFNCPFRDKEIVIDNALIYTLTESREPPRSLHEAVACGDVEEVSNLLAQEAEINGREGSFLRTPLIRAAIEGHREVAHVLLVQGADVDAMAPDGRGGFSNALQFAVRNGNKEVVELLLAEGANVNVYSVFGTPLHYAAEIGRKDIAELLIDNGADINAENSNGQTPIEVAIDKNRGDFVGMLFAKGAKVTIHIAACAGAFAKVKALIEEGVNVNAIDKSGNTALVIAISKNHPEVAEFLVAHGAEVTIQAAAYMGDLDKVKSFLEECVSVNAKDGAGLTPLHAAASGGQDAVVEFLITRGADVNVMYKEECTPLHDAIAGGHSGVAKLLIDHGANVNVGRLSPLHFAARTGNTDVGEYLIANGAKVNTDGLTPLQEAVYHSREMVELLIAKGADVNAGKWTALHSAVEAGRRDIAELLIQKGADVNAKDNTGLTPLHLAVWYRPNVIELLVSKGADVNAKDNKGRTPLWYAQKRGNTEVVELLRKHGAKE